MSQPQDSFLERYFKLKEHRTDVKTEILAGLTTFITMAYIIFVNPTFLAAAGIDHGAAITATIIAAAFATILMGVYANFPIALAPGMGVNAFFAYGIVLGMGIPWQTALGAVFISGFIFLLLTITKARQAIIKAVPQSLRSAIAVGIGLFIAFIGFKNAGIVVANPATFVGLGDLSNPAVMVAIFGLLFTGLLVTRKVKGSFLIGIFVTTIIAMIFKVNTAPPTGLGDLIGMPPSIGPTLGQLDIGAALGMGLITVIFSLTFVDLFDTLGTFMGVTRKAGLMDKEGNVPGMDRALTVDSVGTMAGAVLGTSTTTSYIESAAGIEEGGRTGLTAVTTGILFLLALFFAPLVGLVPAIATAPILILVGIFMMSDVVNIKFADFTESFPAFLTFILMPLTFSIANGIAVGFTAYAIMKTIAGKSKDVGIVMYVLMVLFIIQFAFFGH
jgi:AGZA family xanthine/uracil permease-like MFS transporter